MVGEAMVAPEATEVQVDQMEEVALAIKLLLPNSNLSDTNALLNSILTQIKQTPSGSWNTPTLHPSLNASSRSSSHILTLFFGCSVLMRMTPCMSQK